MAMVVYWYDFICFGIVAVAFCGSLWVIWKKEGSGKYEDRTMYESLLIARPDCEGYVGASRLGHVSSAQLWSSCWRGVHPVWLLLLRVVSFLVMAGFMVWDVLKWDVTIFIYYTEWTFSLVIVYFALGSCMSAYGCWVYSLKPPSENGVTEDLEESWSSTAVTFRAKENRGTIKLQSHYDQEAIQLRAGFLGYLMQIAYQTCGGAVILTDVVFWCVIVPFLSNAHLGLNMLMGCMHTLNMFFLLLDTSLNSLGNFPSCFPAIPLVPVVVFCAMELYLCYFPMGHPRLRISMVAISFSRAFNTMGTSMVFLHGCSSHPLLWTLRIDHESKNYNFFETVPP